MEKRSQRPIDKNLSPEEQQVANIKGGSQIIQTDRPYTDKELHKAVTAEFDANMTHFETLRLQGKALGEEAHPIGKELGPLAGKAYHTAERLNLFTQKLQADETRTAGDKILLKQAEADKLLSQLTNTIDALGRMTVQRADKLRGDLFSASLETSQTEAAMLPIVAAILEKGNADVFALARSTPQEAKAALLLAATYPHIAGKDIDREALTRVADETHTPLIRKELDQVIELLGSLEDTLFGIDASREKYVPSSMANYLRENRL